MEVMGFMVEMEVLMIKQDTILMNIIMMGNSTKNMIMITILKLYLGMGIIITIKMNII